MNSATAYLSNVVLAAAFATGIVTYLKLPLKTLLMELCGTMGRASPSPATKPQSKDDVSSKA
jgi:hypothetical protein